MSSRRFPAVALLAALAASSVLAADSGESTRPPIVSPEAVVGQPLGAPLSGAELDRRTDELASIMRCPVCQALSVADSPTASALAMKEEARDLLAAGYTEEQVLEYFETSYGEFILLAPKKKGLNWLVWVSPVVFLIAGLLIILGRSRVRRPAAASKPAADAELASYAERVRREVGE